MATPKNAEAVVIGSGPNGLAAAITLLRGGVRTTVHEASDQIGGGARSMELTLPGFVHDICSSIYPMAIASPFFESVPTAEFGLEWVHPEAPLAHPLDDGTAVMLERSVDETAAALGPDRDAWRRLMAPAVENWHLLRRDLLGPLQFPRHPILMARFGMDALRSAAGVAASRFRGEQARALFAGLAGHAVMPLDRSPSASVALVLGMVGHAAGWPMARGGSQKITDALAGYARSLGGEIRAGSRITQIPAARLVLCDITPRQLLAIAGDRFPAYYRRALAGYRYGPGAFKMDWALDAPIPWRAPECARAGTVHLGGTLEEIAHWESNFTGRPFVLLAQHTLFDPTRAPAGKHTAWAYCHVPNGSTAEMTEAIEEQIERFAPGFRARILARSVHPPAALEARNSNLVGGDFGGGEMSLKQLFLRPTRLLYATPAEGVFLCSSSTPPGAGVHGMCGQIAAGRALDIL